jgi:hypothetical protein
MAKRIKDKTTNNNLQNTTQRAKDYATQTHEDSAGGGRGVSSNVKESTVLAPLQAPVVLLLIQTR